MRLGNVRGTWRKGGYIAGPSGGARKARDDLSRRRRPALRMRAILKQSRSFLPQYAKHGHLILKVGTVHRKWATKVGKLGELLQLATDATTLDYLTVHSIKAACADGEGVQLVQP